MNVKAPYTNLYLNSNGEFFICENISKIDNIKNHNLNFHDIWQSDESVSRRKKLKECYCNHPKNLNYNFVLN